MPFIGPNAECRIDGKGEHGLAEINWELSKEKTPKEEVGKDRATGFTSGPLMVIWSGQALAKQDGSWGIDWDNWCKLDQEKPAVFSTPGRKERLSGCVVDTVGSAYTRSDGRYVKDISGKAIDHRHE